MKDYRLDQRQCLQNKDGNTIWCWRHGEGGHACGKWCAAFELGNDFDTREPVAILHCCGRKFWLKKDS